MALIPWHVAFVHIIFYLHHYYHLFLTEHGGLFEEFVACLECHLL